MMYFKCARGEELPQAKLTDIDIARIRQQHAAKEETKRKLDAEFSAAAFAHRYNVHVRTIEKILAYETWRHVK